MYMMFDVSTSPGSESWDGTDYSEEANAPLRKMRFKQPSSQAEQSPPEETPGASQQTLLSPTKPEVQPTPEPEPEPEQPPDYESMELVELTALCYDRLDLLTLAHFGKVGEDKAYDQILEGAPINEKQNRDDIFRDILKWIDQQPVSEVEVELDGLRTATNSENWKILLEFITESLPSTGFDPSVVTGRDRDTFLNLLLSLKDTIQPEDNAAPRRRMTLQRA